MPTHHHPYTAGALAIALLLFLGGPLRSEAACRNTQSFAQWLGGITEEAARAGLSPRTLRALSAVRFSRSVINRDRATAVFAQDFLTFAKRMVSSYRLKHGAKHLRQRAQLFDELEHQFGIPGPVITAFWALETDFGANNGDFPTLDALATLAYDCRRPQLFRPQLLDALRLIDAGELSPERMRGAPAGELGQVQFLPSDYWRDAVDWDGDGRRDLIASVPDALASAARLLHTFGWQAGQPWLEEVILPTVLPWEQADVYSPKPWSYWTGNGVKRRAQGHPPKPDVPVSLLLPMGRRGPAFLAYDNFHIYLKWNESLVYTTTAAYLATRLAGAPRLRIIDPPFEPLNLDEVQALQRTLKARGHDVGKVDGIIGARTREAVRAVQLELRLPADAYPTRNLLRRLGVTVTGPAKKGASLP